jgi:hypothetical protein
VERRLTTLQDRLRQLQRDEERMQLAGGEQGQPAEAAAQGGRDDDGKEQAADGMSSGEAEEDMDDIDMGVAGSAARPGLSPADALQDLGEPSDSLSRRVGLCERLLWSTVPRFCVRVSACRLPLPQEGPDQGGRPPAALAGCMPHSTLSLYFHIRW